MTLKYGTFIVVEGIDGSGKTTLIKSLKKQFEAKGVKVNVFSAIGEGDTGKKLKTLCLDLLSVNMKTPQEEVANQKTIIDLFLSGVFNCLLSYVRPAIERGEVVILDRYFHSTFAYQVLNSELEQYFYTVYNGKLNAYPTTSLEPDYVIFCNTTAKLSLERSKGRAGDNVIDSWDIDKKQSIIERYEKTHKWYPGYTFVNQLHLNTEDFTKLDLTEINEMINNVSALYNTRKI